MDYQKQILEALDIFEISDITLEGGMQVKQFKSQLGYVENNWKEAPNGEIYINDSFPGRADLQARVRAVIEKYADRIRAVEDEFSDKYGWTRGAYNEIYEGRGADKVSSVPSNTEEGGL